MTTSDRAFVAAAVAIAAFALLLSWSASSLYGLGIDADGVWNLSAGVHLAHGRGLVTSRDELFTLWPPLYPLSMAALEFAGLDVLAGLRVLHVLALAATLALSARLVWVLSGSRWAVLATLGSLALSSRVHEFTIQIMSETFFVPLVLGALLAALAHFEARSSGRFIALIVLSALVCLQRYAGVVVVATLAVALALHEQGDLLRRARCAALYACCALGPLAAWLVRNHVQEGTLTGGRDAASASTRSTLSDAASTLARWIVPDGAPLWIALVLYAIALGLVVRAVLEPARRRAWALCAASAGVYLVFMAGVAAAVRLDKIGDRLLHPALPLLVALGWASCFRAARTSGATIAALLLVGASWTAGATRLVGHHERWRNDGAGTLHTRLWQEHALTRELRRRSIDGPCWSNAPELVWMLQRVPVRFVAAGGRAWERAGERASRSGGTLAWFQDGGRPKGSLHELEQRVRTSVIAPVEDGLLLRLEPAERR